MNLNEDILNIKAVGGVHEAGSHGPKHINRSYIK